MLYQLTFFFKSAVTLRAFEQLFAIVDFFMLYQLILFCENTVTLWAFEWFFICMDPFMLCQFTFIFKIVYISKLQKHARNAGIFQQILSLSLVAVANTF